MNDNTDALHTALANDEVLYSELESRARYAGAVAKDEGEFFEILADEIWEVACDNSEHIPGYSHTEPIDYTEVNWEEIARTYEYNDYRDSE
jgi:hypothetical protein